MIDDDLDLEGKRRDALYRMRGGPYPTIRTDAHRIGLLGERAFASEFGFAFDAKSRPVFDGGVDFVLPVDFAVDVKTTRLSPPCLMVPTLYCRAGKIYVLASYRDGDTSAPLVGWEWGSALLKTTPRDFGPGILNYWLPAHALRPIAELKARMSKSDER